MGVIRVMTLVMYILFIIGDSPHASCVVVDPILRQGTEFPEQCWLAIVFFVKGFLSSNAVLILLGYFAFKRPKSSCVALPEMKHLQ